VRRSLIARPAALFIVLSLGACECGVPVEGDPDGASTVDAGHTLDDASAVDATAADLSGVDLTRPDSGGVDAGAAADSGSSDLAQPDLGQTTPDSGAGDDSSVADAAPQDATVPPQPGFAQAPLGTSLSRAWVYVLTHEPFISGLTVTMGEVTPAVIDRYFDDFNATAVHTWADGLGVPINSWRQQGDVPYVSWITDVGLSTSNSLELGGMPADVPGRIGYQIGDEPRDQAEFDVYWTGVQVAQQQDPNALVILNWSYHAEDLLPGFFQTAAETWNVDIFSYDTYSTSRDVYERYDQFSKVCRQYDMPCWRYLDSYWDGSHDDDLAEIDMRWDAFAGLVFGYSGHTWFLYQVAAGSNGLHSNLFDVNNDWDALPTEKFAWAARINRDLRFLGETTNQLKPLDARFAYHWPTIPDWGIAIALPPGVDVWEVGAGGDPYLQSVGCPEGEADMDIPIGFFEDGFGSRYVMVQNGNHPGGSWPTESDQPGELLLSFDFSTAPAGFDPSILRTLDLQSEQIVHLPLTDLGGGLRELRHSLDAGEVLLFKYANGEPFARRAP